MGFNNCLDMFATSFETPAEHTQNTFEKYGEVAGKKFGTLILCGFPGVARCAVNSFVSRKTVSLRCDFEEWFQPNLCRPNAQKRTWDHAMVSVKNQFDVSVSESDLTCLV